MSKLKDLIHRMWDNFWNNACKLKLLCEVEVKKILFFSTGGVLTAVILHMAHSGTVTWKEMTAYAISMMLVYMPQFAKSTVFPFILKALRVWKGLDTRTVAEEENMR